MWWRRGVVYEIYPARSAGCAARLRRAPRSSRPRLPQRLQAAAARRLAAVLDSLAMAELVATPARLRDVVDVAARAAVDEAAPEVHGDRVVARARVDHVAAVGAVDEVVAAAAEDAVELVRRLTGAALPVTPQDVGSPAAEDPVGAVVAEQLVRAPRAVERRGVEVRLPEDAVDRRPERVRGAVAARLSGDVVGVCRRGRRQSSEHGDDEDRPDHGGASGVV